jgi:hypothetical protein
MSVTYFGAVDDRIATLQRDRIAVDCSGSAKIAHQAYQQYLLRGRAGYRVESSLWLD